MLTEQAEYDDLDPPIEQPEERASLFPRPVRLAILMGLIAFLGFRGGLSALVVVGAMVVMIFLHELGHYLAARISGMKVLQFFLGFGPTIWSFQRGETEYGIKMIPAGAYVKVLGMTGLEDVDAHEEHRTYRQASYPRRMLLAVAGSLMHFLQAFAFIFVILVFFGAPRGAIFLERPEPDPATWQVGRVSASSAAEAIGLESGDRIESVDGTAVATFDQLGEAVRPAPGETVEIEWSRDGREMAADATLGVNTETGTGLLGVTESYALTKVNPAAAVVQSGQELGSFMWQSAGQMARLLTPSGIGNMFSQVRTGGETAATGDNVAPDVSADGGDDSGRMVSIVGAAQMGTALYRAGTVNLLLFLVAINVFIGLFNLIPLLPLDGGHVAIATYERIREGIARTGRRYLVDMTKLMPLTYTVVFILIGIGVSSLYLDIVNPVEIP